MSQLPYRTLPQPGEVFEVRYPFVRSTYVEPDYSACPEDGPTAEDRPTWKPGIENVVLYDDCYAIAHGLGTMRLTVVSTHRPPGYPARVFFTRLFVDPDGKEFGKRKLHIVTGDKFRRLASGYQLDYQVRVPAQPSGETAP